MTGREALMPAAILHVVTFPIRYTTKKLICTIMPVKQKMVMVWGSVSGKHAERIFEEHNKYQCTTCCLESPFDHEDHLQQRELEPDTLGKFQSPNPLYFI